MDYKEYIGLVKRLYAVVGNREDKCAGCPYEEEFPCCVDCLDKMHADAADAINELYAAVKGYEDSTEMVFVKEGENTYIRTVPKWFSVEEKLPPMWEPVQLLFGQNQAVGFWDDGVWCVFIGNGLYSEVGPNEGKPMHWAMTVPAPKEGR